MNEINKKTLTNYIDKINDYLSCAVNTNKCEQIIIYDAMKYSLLAGGKRIRPILILEFYKMCGGEGNILDIASSIEMIHTFSLIHDDLPCMDNDDYRRGKYSCHKQFDEATALLAGDALSILPFEIISNSAINGNISYKDAIKITNLFACCVGSNGMIGGQVIDIQNENKSVDIELLKKLDSLKTGELIKAACVCGCILANADENKIKLATEYAEKIGLAFQIVDDILDVTSNFETLGKPINSDKEQCKDTFVSILGIEKSKQYADNLTKEALDILAKFNNNSFMIDLTNDLLNRNK